MSFFDKLQEPVFEDAGFGVPLYVFPLFLIATLVFAAFFIPQTVGLFVALLFFLWPLWLPVLLAFGAWEAWIRYRNAAFLYDQETVLLEIKIPREVQKSPLAMETVLAGLHIKPGESNWYDRWVNGKIRPWFSLEITSFGGDLHFFIWTRKKLQQHVENNFYAQYPEVQLVEVEDYTLTQTTDLSKVSLWGCHYALSKDDAYPIKTYVDYGLHQDPKEEFKIDPFANLLEALGSVGKGEQIWLQFMIQRTRKKWRKEGEDKIKELKKEGDAESGTETAFGMLPKNLQVAIEAIERNTGKQGFDVGVRSLYLGKPEVFNPTRISSVVSLFRQFSSESLNGIDPNGGMAKYSDYPWESERDKEKTRKGLLEAFKRRSYFYPPYNDYKPFVLSTEELATLFRLPSSAVEVPTLSRTQSATSSAPPNLPT